MTSVTFVDTVTRIPADWANDVDHVVYGLLGAPATLGALKATLGIGTLAAQAVGSVAITGGAINNTVIGAVTPVAGTFSALNVVSQATQPESVVRYDTLQAAIDSVVVGTGFLPIAGGTMLGDLVLQGNPTAALHPVTKQLFDAAIALRPIRLAAPLHLYVRKDGLDTHDGLADTAGGAFLTVQRAINEFYKYDTSNYGVVIHIGDGDYSIEDITVGGRHHTFSIFANAPGNRSDLEIVGNVATPANVKLGLLITISIDFTISGLDLTGLYTYNCRSATGYGCGVTSIRSDDFQFDFYSCVRVVDCTVKAGTKYAPLGVSFYSMVMVHGDFTFEGVVGVTATFLASTFAYLGVNCTFVGTTPTGSRYKSELSSILHTFGAGATKIPGTIAGTVVSGAQYL